MPLKHWLPTFISFPIGGYLAFATMGSLDGPLSAAAGGLLTGAVIGGAQWLALRSRGIGRRWIAYTAVAMASGSATAATVTGAGTELADVVLLGLASGAAVGAAQSTLLARGWRAQGAWTAVSAASWSLAWPVSASIIDIERGWYVFGSSGALLVTVLTGLTLRRLAAPPAAAPQITPIAAAPA